MPEYTEVTLTGPKRKLEEALTTVRTDLEDQGMAVLPIPGDAEVGTRNLLLCFTNDDYGEGPDAPVIAEVKEKEE